MEQKYEVFICAAENLSMSAAAKKLFVSHQCVSEHIRKLEQEYQAQLFHRKPKLALTSEGQEFLTVLYQIRVLQEGLKNRLSQNHTEITGHIRLGVPMSRYSFLTPRIVAAFRKEFPSVKISVISDYSSGLMDRLRRGLLDLTLSAQEPEGTELGTAFSVPDPFCFVVPEQLIRQRSPELLRRWEADRNSTVSLRELSVFPMILYPPSSRIRQALDSYASRHGISFDCVFESNRIETFLDLSVQLSAGCLIPGRIYEPLQRSWLAEADGIRPVAIPADLDPADLPLQISLLYNKNAYPTEYKTWLIAKIREILGQ